MTAQDAFRLIYRLQRLLAKTSGVISAGDPAERLMRKARLWPVLYQLAGECLHHRTDQERSSAQHANAIWRDEYSCPYCGADLDD